MNRKVVLEINRGLGALSPLEFVYSAGVAEVLSASGASRAPR